MLDPESRSNLRDAIAGCIETDRGVLDGLREEIRPLRDATRKIQSRTTTSVSIVGTDGGNNQISFDPFLIQIVRVVDSSNNEYCLEVVTPTIPMKDLNARQFDSGGRPQTPLGEMMAFLGVSTLQSLSHMIRPASGGGPPSPNWVGVYRELVEWAIVFSILEKDFGTDTLIVRDGLLRSKVFGGDLFQRLIRGMEVRMENQWRNHRRRVYLAGVAKRSKVIDRYRLAMALEEVLQTGYPAFVEVPREVEEKAYRWTEYARGDDDARSGEGREINKYVGGKMFLVKFGARERDPVWPVDIFVPQMKDAQTILGSLLGDAINGFPVPHYPKSLQSAHDNAALVDFDFAVLQDLIFEYIRGSLGGGDASAIDAFMIQDPDPASGRYD